MAKALASEYREYLPMHLWIFLPFSLPAHILYKTYRATLYYMAIRTLGFAGFVWIISWTSRCNHCI